MGFQYLTPRKFRRILVPTFSVLPKGHRGQKSVTLSFDMTFGKLNVLSCLLCIPYVNSLPCVLNFWIYIVFQSCLVLISFAKFDLALILLSFSFFFKITLLFCPLYDFLSRLLTPNTSPSSRDSNVVTVSPHSTDFPDSRFHKSWFFTRFLPDYQLVYADYWIPTCLNSSKLLSTLSQLIIA